MSFKKRRFAFFDFEKTPKSVFEKYKSLKGKVQEIMDKQLNLLERREEIKKLKKDAYEFFTLVGMEAFLGM